MTTSQINMDLFTAGSVCPITGLIITEQTQDSVQAFVEGRDDLDSRVSLFWSRFGGRSWRERDFGPLSCETAASIAWDIGNDLHELRLIAKDVKVAMGIDPSIDPDSQSLLKSLEHDYTRVCARADNILTHYKHVPEDDDVRDLFIDWVNEAAESGYDLDEVTSWGVSDKWIMPFLKRHCLGFPNSTGLVRVHSSMLDRRRLHTLEDRLQA